MRAKYKILVDQAQKKHPLLQALFGGGRWIRTPDLLITNQLLYQLSYTSSSNSKIYITRYKPFCQQDFAAFFGFFPGSRSVREGRRREDLLRNFLRRRFWRGLLCTLCGREITEGECYWYLNGASVCDDCFSDFAKGELAPYRHVRGREAEL